MVISTGILMWKKVGVKTLVFLVHPGGPYFQGLDNGSWSIPKGLLEDNSKPEDNAKREFKEETGFDAPKVLAPLGTFQTRFNKKVMAWTGEPPKVFDETKCFSNTCTIPWMNGELEIPEIDKWKWFDLKTAKEKITQSQKQILEEFERKPPNKL